MYNGVDYYDHLDQFRQGLGYVPQDDIVHPELTVAQTEPAVRGDTSGKVLKPARLKTGYEIQVPLFCATGDKIEIDTRTGEYRSRTKG